MNKLSIVLISLALYSINAQADVNAGTFTDANLITDKYEYKVVSVEKKQTKLENGNIQMVFKIVVEKITTDKDGNQVGKKQYTYYKVVVYSPQGAIISEKNYIEIKNAAGETVLEELPESCFVPSVPDTKPNPETCEGRYQASAPVITEVLKLNNENKLENKPVEEIPSISDTTKLTQVIEKLKEIFPNVMKDVTGGVSINPQDLLPKVISHFKFDPKKTIEENVKAVGTLTDEQLGFLIYFLAELFADALKKCLEKEVFQEVTFNLICANQGFKTGIDAAVDAINKNDKLSAEAKAKLIAELTAKKDQLQIDMDKEHGKVVEGEVNKASGNVEKTDVKTVPK